MAMVTIMLIRWQVASEDSVQDCQQWGDASREDFVAGAGAAGGEAGAGGGAAAKPHPSGRLALQSKLPRSSHCNREHLALCRTEDQTFEILEHLLTPSNQLLTQSLKMNFVYLEADTLVIQRNTERECEIFSRLKYMHHAEWVVRLTRCTKLYGVLLPLSCFRFQLAFVPRHRHGQRFRCRHSQLLSGCCNGGVATFRHIYSVVSYQRLYYHYYRISHQLIVKYINILWVVQDYCGGGGVFLLIFKLNVCCDCRKNLGHLLKLLAVLFFMLQPNDKI